MEGLKCVTINVNGIREPPKRHAFLQWLSHLRPHILSCAEATSWFASSGFQAISSPGTNHSCGTILLYKSDFRPVNSWTDRDGRFVQGEFVKNDLTFRVAGVYAPNRNPERETFYTYIEDMVDPAKPTILCGDFNAVFNRTTDRRGSNPLNHTHDSCHALRALFSNCCVTDIWRRLHPTERGYSWCKWDGSVASRIDLIGCPTSWLTHALSCSLLPCPFSDHSAVLFTCSLPVAIPRGPGRWKLNCSLLESSEYINLIRTFWTSWRGRKPSFPSLQHWWDEGKKRIRGISVHFSCEQSKIKSVRRATLSFHPRWWRTNTYGHKAPPRARASHRRNPFGGEPTASTAWQEIKWEFKMADESRLKARYRIAPRAGGGGGGAILEVSMRGKDKWYPLYTKSRGDVDKSFSDLSIGTLERAVL